MFPPEPYCRVDDKLVREKLATSDAIAANPLAKVSASFVEKIIKLFDAKTMDQRIDIIVEHLQREYNNDNISKQAVIDTVKKKKIYYFMTGDKERMTANVIKRFRARTRQ